MSATVNWRPKKAFDKRKVLYPVIAIVALTITALITALATHKEVPPPPPPPPVPTEHALSALEASGLNVLLDRQRTGAHRATGTISVAGRKLGIQLIYLADGSSGAGTLSAGSTRGEVLVDQNVVYLRGDEAFWTALGVLGAPPPPPGWVNIGPEFLEGKVFYPPTAWTAVLAPNPQSRIDGNRYTTVAGKATISGPDIAHFSVDGVDADVIAAKPEDVTAAAAPLNEGRGPGAPIHRDSKGQWSFGPSLDPVPAPEPGETESLPKQK